MCENFMELEVSMSNMMFGLTCTEVVLAIGLSESTGLSAVSAVCGKAAINRDKALHKTPWLNFVLDSSLKFFILLSLSTRPLPCQQPASIC
jgi:hypothetical protein